MPEPQLRVLLVLAQATGGIGRHVRTLADGLPTRGLEVTLCAPQGSVDALDLGKVRARLVVTPLGGTTPGALRRTAKILARESGSVDLIHAHGLRAGADCASFARGVPLIVTWHNAPRGGWGRRVAHAALTRYVARTTALTLAASDDLATAARRAGASAVRTTFVPAPPLPAATRTRLEVRSELGVADRPLVLAIARLHPQKRLDVLIAASTSWAADPAGPVVVIAGDGPAREELSAQIAATNAPVTLLGAREDIADLLAAADVVALPSEWEARSLVAQEALRAGVPLVTTPVGGLTELVGEAATMVAVGDVAGLRGGIELVLGDAERRGRMIALGRARALTWPNDDQNIDELVATYLDLNHRMRL